MSFTRRPVLGRPRQTSRRKDRHMIRNAHVQPTASSATIQAQVAPSLGNHVSPLTIQRRLAEGHMGPRRPLRVLPFKSTHRCLRLELCHTLGIWTAAEWNQVSLETNSDSISALIRIVYISGDPVVNAAILTLLYSNTLFLQLV
ncbi:HTH_Tnp_Tc3_2 domain-containing protein [Trichonephila clavipes]|nr:HTH_Tnp_Tc3_2 domain-containing protein [Trichonephila clavipes]